jgi:hypothetical protein
MSERRFLKFAINERFTADCVESERSRAGEIYDVVLNSAGGATLTRIARYFCWRPSLVEGFHRHWRVDCFVREHPLSPSEISLATDLVKSLMREGICSEPILVSAHRSKELESAAFGEVFDYH